MKSKLQRFAIIAERDNVIEPGKELFDQVKGKWNELYFRNEHPITLELACGRGEYSVALAANFPERNFIGVDKKGDRIWKGSTWAVERGLSNVAFLRTQMLNLAGFFSSHEADEIWITFPDPRPRKRDIKRRLTSPRFLDLYKEIVRPGGWVRLKTDNAALFDYSLSVLKERNDVTNLTYTHDLYQSPLRAECHDIKTRYEELFTAKGEVIKYLRFCFTNL